MAYETLVAVFDIPEHAEAAVEALKTGGFHDDDISVFDKARLAAGKSAISKDVKEAGLWHRLLTGTCTVTKQRCLVRPSTAVARCYVCGCWTGRSPMPAAFSIYISRSTCKTARLRRVLRRRRR